MAVKAWQLGAPGTGIYRFYDWLRSRLNSRLVEYLLSRGIAGEKTRVLEAGSGPAFASSILARDSRVELSIAADIDIEALHEARNRDPQLALVVADLQSLPFRSESVDLCWNSSTIEHLAGPDAAIAEMHRVTRRGGKVFVGVPNLYGPLGFQRWISQTPVGIWIGTTFNRSQLQAIMAGAGVRPKHTIFYFFRFFVGVLGEK
ncbi:MAG: class I SAM-dependent methyltransferase [Desulfomonile tiedjei]|nr:class I SAM-dependent methyltransferase [Desulfomonile tiedjei]